MVKIIIYRKLLFFLQKDSIAPGIETFFTKQQAWAQMKRYRARSGIESEKVF